MSRRGSKHQRAPMTADRTVDAYANTRDGIVAAEKLGAALDVMEDAWGARVVAQNGNGRHHPTVPSSVIVGQRTCVDSIFRGNRIRPTA